MKNSITLIRFIILLALFLIFNSCQYKSDVSKNQIVTDELEMRIQNAYSRIMYGKSPELTQDFLLACLSLDKKYDRRFTNFSGDQPGRYLSIMSIRDVKNNPIDIQELVNKIILLQRKDGRFGNDSLSFATNEISGEHMALLWGNGRLFAGLLDYYGKYKYEKALKSAQKLGDFLLGVTINCTTPENIDRLKKMGAMGFICFTQNIEGLVKLYRFTNDKKYIQIAEEIYPLLPERGTQHSHGFLNTIRGVMMLYEETKKPEQLEYAIKKYDEVINAKDFQITGGVPEFFGDFIPREGYRNEGCSEADFLMLSLALWHSTRNMKYLDKAEYCLMNELFCNQYQTGDFGSHQIDTAFGFRTYYIEDRAWWCCTYHGIMGMVDAQNCIVSKDIDTRKVNLYFQHQYSDDAIEFSINKGESGTKSYQIVIQKAENKEIEISLRKPYWAKEMKIKLNDKNIDMIENNGYLGTKRQWAKNDIITIVFEYNLLITGKYGKTYSYETLPSKPFKGALLYGPYILGTDDEYNWEFMSEPSWYNLVYIEQKMITSPTNPDKTEIPAKSTLPEAYMKTLYKHEGMYGDYSVMLRPISENTFQHPSNVQVWFNFQKR